MPKTFYTAFTFIVLLFNNCTPKQTTATTDTVTQPDKILFLAYEAQKDTLSSNIIFKVLHQILANGSYQEIADPGVAKENDILISFVDKDDKILHSQTIKNPFTKNFEGVNDDGKLVQQQVQLTKAEITFRTSYNSNMQTVKMQLVGANNKLQNLFQHTITIK